MKKIMIVEDDSRVRKQLSDLLKNSGYDTCFVTDFTDTAGQILSRGADMVLLDINIPGINGEMVLSRIRKVSSVPVIMVTSRSGEADEVLSMSWGADDYITKPYNPTILLLRINALFKRARGSQALTYKDIRLNTARGTLQKGDKTVLLTKNELLILSHLMSNPGRLVSRDELMTLLWNNNEFINDNALTVNISRLRAKLKEAGYEERIETRKGMGYILI